MPDSTSPRIEHVVVLMLENRSFDHMLGLLPNPAIDGVLSADGHTIRADLGNTVAGRPNPFPVTRGADFTTPEEQINKQGFGGPSHSYPAATMQVYGADVAPVPLPAAAMTGFAQSYFKQLTGSVHIAHPTDQQIGVPMACFTPDQAPVISALAQEFCVCDQWYSEVPGPTQPNRLFVHAGTSQGFTHNVWSHPFNIPTIYDELDKAGRDWGVYYFDLRDTDSFPQIKKRTTRIKKFDSFAADAASANLPSYSFLCPRFDESKTPGDPQPNSQHAPYDVRNGENLIADVYEALRDSPLWPTTCLIITYDEHGGFYDHVTPPSNAPNPDGLASPTDTDRQAAVDDPRSNDFLLKPDYVFDFTRLGVRVPSVIVSPLIPRRTVLKTPLQHTSIFATLRDLYGVGSLTERDKAAASFTSVFSLATPRDDTPKKLVRPIEPQTLAAMTPDTLWAPLTHQQVEMWPLLSQLDGHPDSGKVVDHPATREQAALYIEERIAAHNAFHRERRRKADYQITRGPDGAYSWRFLNENGDVIAVSPQSYPSHAAAEQVIAQIRDLGPFARQTDVTGVAAP